MSITIQENVSLIPFSSPVFVQGAENSCGPCATYNALQTIGNLDGHQFASNVQVQYDMNEIARVAAGYPAFVQDAGVLPDQMMSLLTTLGVTQNTSMAYAPSNITLTPSAADYADAATHTATFDSISLLPYHGAPSLGSITEAALGQEVAAQIIQGKPVLMAFTLFSGMRDEATIPLLANQDGMNVGSTYGGHFVAIDAIDTASNMLTVQSWGPQYGDNGYFHISLDSFYTGIQAYGPVEANIANLYTITGFDGIDLHQTTATATVAACYTAILNRAPELSGMAAWSSAVNAGVSLATMCDGFLQSPEAIGNGLGANATNTAFVSALYQSVLNRPVDPSGLAAYTHQLDVGMSRGTIASELIAAIIDSADWSGNTFTRNTGDTVADTLLMNESLLFNNKVQAGEDYAITLQAGDAYASIGHALLTTITADPGSVTASLVGVPEALGHAHIVSPVL